MTTDTDSQLHTQLRAWAEGSNPLAAAVELLIHGGLAYSGAPWVRTDHGWDTSAVDFDRLGYELGALSGGEQRLARIASSLAQGVPVDLREDIAGLDLAHTRWVMTAVAHAAGFTEPGKTIEEVDGMPTFVSYPALATWESD